MKRTVIVGIASMVAALVLGPRATLAAVVPEVEPNNTAEAPQTVAVDAGGSVTILAELVPAGSVADLPAGGDTDFFRFRAEAGDIITVDIDGASDGEDASGADTGGFNSFIALYGQGLTRLSHNTDSAVIDAGSNNQHDSFLSEGITVSGEYVVGVTYTPRVLLDGGVLNTSRDFVSGGTYTLIISGVTPPPPPTDVPGPGAGDEDPFETQNVAIKVRPGKKHLVRLNPKSHQKLRVAILSSDTFDAVTEVDTDSLTFGQTGTEPSLKKCRKRGKDVNRDGFKDLICKFYVNKAGFEVGDSVGILKGYTYSGTPMEGHGFLKVKAEGRKHHKGHKGKHRSHKGKHHSHKGKHHSRKGKHRDKDDHDDDKDDDKYDRDDNDDKDDHDDD